MFFENKIVWITGASSGIGEQLAYSFTKNGATVILSARNLKKLETIQKNCAEIGGECSVFQLDLADIEQIEEVSEKVIQRYGKIDVLINNGGVSQRSTSMETHPDVDRKIMETNFFGAVALTKKVLPAMINKGGGHIAVTSSIFGIIGFKSRTLYSASKHALHGYFESLRFELKDKNINVTIVCPGRVDTAISLNALKKDGQLNQKAEAGLKRGMSAEKCSEKYLKAIIKNKRVALIGGKELILVYLKRFIPPLFYKIADRISET
jgi:short-subunit dehydrogenase